MYSASASDSDRIAKPLYILLVEDNPGDVRLAQEAFVNHRLDVVSDGEDAMAFLHRVGKHAVLPRPDLILLDLNLPRKDGRQVLAEIKDDASLRSIPVIVLTTSQAEKDVSTCYNLHANCYINKPDDFDQFLTVASSIEAFWFNLVRLPANA